MDKEEARFILRCFRPDGADAGNPDFAEALAWAAKDRELGEWLAHERSQDADFATALNAVVIPGELREEILTGLAMERGDLTPRPDAFDHSLMGAMAAICPPAGLRCEILAAMQRTAAPRRSWKWTWLWGAPLAAAAGIAFAFVGGRPDAVVTSTSGLAQNEAPAKRARLASNDDLPAGNVGTIPVSTISISKVETGFIDTYEDPRFTLDLKNPDHHALFEHLKAAKLPCPNACLPKGLKDVPGLGCRELKIDGKRGALVCFKQEDDLVHLVAFKRCDVKCRLPEKGEPDISKHGKWSVARWADDEWVYVLMGENKIDAQRLKDLF
ncbi:hypothetical protein [Luteolibacter luteus]|uniref:Uncharacterized protein n=1 Tax=Luteolibacter luteus TaxID=2728835 RepID=A0A858RL46_9BACT|nr:hypothetical protein [Luteolibacter luteus]QJE97109.1 hypothetical protein HHL09_15380 [Luteolibacter luteus]